MVLTATGSYGQKYQSDIEWKILYILAEETEVVRISLLERLIMKEKYCVMKKGIIQRDILPD